MAVSNLVIETPTKRISTALPCAANVYEVREYCRSLTGFAPESVVLSKGIVIASYIKEEYLEHAAYG